MSASRTTRRLVAAVLASGALVGAAALPAVADDHRGRHHGNQRHSDQRHSDQRNSAQRNSGQRSAVVLGQVKYDAPGRDDRSNNNLNKEWVEVSNTGRQAVNLRGWTLSDSDGNRYRFKNVRLAGHSTVRIHTGIGSDSRRDLFQDRRREVWDNRDSATLRNDRGRVVDTDSWGRRYR